MKINSIMNTALVGLLLATTACGGGNHPKALGDTAVYGPDSKPQATPNVAYDTQRHFDENGQMLPARPLTRTEAIMIHQIRVGGHEFAMTHIVGKAGSFVKKTAIAAILQGIGTVAGAFFASITGLNPIKYGIIAAGSGAGGGAYSAVMSIEQAREYADLAWQAQQISGLKTTGDRRLVEVVAIPVLAGLSGTPMPVDWSKITPTPRQRCAASKVGEKPLTPDEIAKCVEKTPKIDDDTDRSLPFPG